MNSYLANLLPVLIGSAIGGAARYGVTVAVNRWLGEGFPWGTLAVNVSGALLVGLLAAFVGSGGIAGTPETRLLLMVGLCGSYTTVSSFALQTLALARTGKSFQALANVVASLLLCLVAVWLGLLLGSSFFTPESAL